MACKASKLHFSYVGCCNLHHCLLYHPNEDQIKCILLRISKMYLI